MCLPTFDLETDYYTGGEEDATSEYPKTKFSSLMARDQLIDTVVLLGEKFLQLNEDSSGNWTVEDGMTDLHKCAENPYRLPREFDHKRDPYSYTSPPQSLHDAYWRTLIGGRTETTCRTPAKLGKEFDTWRRFMAEAVPRLFSILNQPGFAKSYRNLCTRSEILYYQPRLHWISPAVCRSGRCGLDSGSTDPVCAAYCRGAVVERGLSCPVSSRGGGVCSWIDVGDVVGRGGGLEAQVLEIV
jgi:hypothetical protein